ncbi:MAG: ribonuclease D [Saprospiraceae bacterium]|nr:ribonuclease D [Saprospiraceae bacterium]MBP7699647.1 ribonuclease D [Saprospiraceae bacterium]
MKNLPKYELITTDEQLAAACEQLQHLDWIGFDTEFISEKRFETLLCLIQLSSASGYYIIDVLTIKNITPFLAIIQNPNILKITHAGINDYKVLYQLFGVLPKNTFDTQIAAGFIGYKYPASFQFIVERETGVYLHKGLAVTDWEKRPIQIRQLEYALEDVVYLKKLHEKLSKKINKFARQDWAQQEFLAMEDEALYLIDPNKEALANSLMQSLPIEEKVFMLRLYDWRRRQASRLNYSKEMILPTKNINIITKNMKHGKENILINRRISKSIIQKYWDDFKLLYDQPIKPSEVSVLDDIKPTEEVDTVYELKMDMLYLMVQYICEKARISPAFVWTRTSLNRMKTEKEYFDESLLFPWRLELLSDAMVNMIQHRHQLEFDIKDKEIALVLP